MICVIAGSFLQEIREVQQVTKKLRITDGSRVILYVFTQLVVTAVINKHSVGKRKKSKPCALRW